MPEKAPFAARGMFAANEAANEVARTVPVMTATTVPPICPKNWLALVAETPAIPKVAHANP